MNDEFIAAAAAGDAVELGKLIGRGASMEHKDPKLGRTALIWSAFVGNTDCVRLLVNAGANKEAKSKQEWGLSALDAADFGRSVALTMATWTVCVC
jgi:ankyrin repeat protein